MINNQAFQALATRIHETTNYLLTQHDEQTLVAYGQAVTHVKNLTTDLPPAFFNLLLTLAQQSSEAHATILRILTTKSEAANSIAQSLVNMPHSTLQTSPSHEAVFLTSADVYLRLLKQIAKQAKDHSVLCMIGVLLKTGNTSKFGEVEINPGETLGKSLLNAHLKTAGCPALITYFELLTVLVSASQEKLVFDVLSQRSGALKLAFLHVFAVLDTDATYREACFHLLTHLAQKNANLFNQLLLQRQKRELPEGHPFFSDKNNVLALIAKKGNSLDILLTLDTDGLPNTSLTLFESREKQLVEFILEQPASAEKLALLEKIVNHDEGHPSSLNHFFWRTCGGLSERTRDNWPLKGFTEELHVLRFQFPDEAREIADKFVKTKPVCN